MNSSSTLKVSSCELRTIQRSEWNWDKFNSKSRWTKLRDQYNEFNWIQENLNKLKIIGSELGRIEKKNNKFKYIDENLTELHGI